MKQKSSKTAKIIDTTSVAISGERHQLISDTTSVAISGERHQLISDTLSPKEFIINYQEIDEVLSVLTKADSIKFNPTTQKYHIDEYDFTLQFFNETCSKLSHYINAVHNIMAKAQITTNVEYNKLQVNDIFDKNTMKRLDDIKQLTTNLTIK
jgi:hypothetical protein